MKSKKLLSYGMTLLLLINNVNNNKEYFGNVDKSNHDIMIPYENVSVDVKKLVRKNEKNLL